MKLIEFECDEDQLQQHQAELADTVKQSLFEEREDLFDLLEFSNDRIFLEPALFCHFLSDVDKEKQIPLEQVLYGYIDPSRRPQQLPVKSDPFGLVNLPNLGYLKTTPLQNFNVDTAQVAATLQRDRHVNNSGMRLCLHPTDHLGAKGGVLFHEPTAQTLANNADALAHACAMLQNNLPEFWNLVASVTRELVVFASPNHNSFAGIGQHGTAYLNVEHHRPSMVFFVEDIAHQCGHVIFNALTLDTDQYLRVPKNTLISSIKNVGHDTRIVYGAFHGLFTYTCILHCLHGVLQSNVDVAHQREATARMGFFLDKFGRDLDLMRDPRILTEAGMDFHQQFRQCHNFIKDKYEQRLDGLDYSNQPYIFQYDIFENVNRSKVRI